MRDFPFGDCPTAVDLRAFLQEQSVEPLSSTVSARIREHLQACPDCARVSANWGDLAKHFARRPSPDEEVSQLGKDAMDKNSLAVASNRSTSLDSPKVGEVWATHRSWSSFSPSNPVESLVVVVLRTCVRPFSDKPVVDVAPVTEDPQLAAEWSLILPPQASDTRRALVAHLDFQVTTFPRVLARRVGRLVPRFADTLREALERYDSGTNDSAILESAHFGKAWTRCRAEWQTLQNELEDLVDDFSNEFEVDVESDLSKNIERSLDLYNSTELFPKTRRHTSRAYPALPVAEHGWPAAGLGSVSNVSLAPGDAAAVAMDRRLDVYPFSWEDLTKAEISGDDDTASAYTTSKLPYSYRRFAMKCASLTALTADTLGTAIVCYVVRDTAPSQHPARFANAVPDELKAVETIRVGELLAAGDWRSRLQTLTGRTFSPSTLSIVDGSLKDAAAATLRGAPILSKAARRQP